MKRKVQQIAGFLLILLLSVPVVGADLQGRHQLKVKIPAVLKLNVGTEEISFNLENEEYPVESYPAYFTPTSGQDYRTVSVFSNLKDEWQLKIRGESGELPLDKIEWSIDKENWSHLAAEDQLVVTGEKTNGWREIKVFYRLVLNGEEYAGNDYKINVFYELSSL